MKIKEKILLIVLVFILLGLITVAVIFKPFWHQSIEVSYLSEGEIEERLGEGSFIPTFTEIETGYSHLIGEEGTSFVGSALIDVNDDGVEEVFVGGGAGQKDVLLQFDGANFNDVAADYGLDGVGPTLGALSIDAHGDGGTDLFVARSVGLTYYRFEENGFVDGAFPGGFADKAMPFAIAAGDTTNDGFFDLYISTFIRPKYFKSATFNDPEHLTTNVLVTSNDGDFRSDTERSGIDFKQNTFASTFVDLNNDGLQDFVAATNTDRVKIYKNMGDGVFEKIEDPVGYGFWMGLAVADIDNDGDQDLFFTNSGNTLPKYVAMGDLRDDQVFKEEWSLLRNDGDFNFTEVAGEKGLADFEFAWGADFADFNLDGREDLIVMENYVKWPAHKWKKLPGRFLIQDKDGNFVPTEHLSGVENNNYGMAPLVSDFNLDGYPDLFYVNLDGPSRAFLNDGGDNHYVTVQMPDSGKSLGAKITLTKGNGDVLTQQFITGTGLLSDQSSNLYFGLDEEEAVQSVEVKWSSGEVTLLEDVEVDSIISLK